MCISPLLTTLITQNIAQTQSGLQRMPLAQSWLAMGDFWPMMQLNKYTGNKIASLYRNISRDQTLLGLDDWILERVFVNLVSVLQCAGACNIRTILLACLHYRLERQLSCYWAMSFIVIGIKYSNVIGSFDRNISVIENFFNSWNKIKHQLRYFLYWLLDAFEVKIVLACMFCENVMYEKELLVYLAYMLFKLRLTNVFQVYADMKYTL